MSYPDTDTDQQSCNVPCTTDGCDGHCTIVAEHTGQHICANYHHFD